MRRLRSRPYAGSTGTSPTIASGTSTKPAKVGGPPRRSRSQMPPAHRSSPTTDRHLPCPPSVERKRRLTSVPAGQCLGGAPRHPLPRTAIAERPSAGRRELISPGDPNVRQHLVGCGRSWAANARYDVTSIWGSASSTSP